MDNPSAACVDVILFQLRTWRCALLAKSLAEMAPLDNRKPPDRLVWLHELFSIDISRDAYHTPCILNLLQPAPLSGLVVDQVASHLLRLEIDRIHPLPAAIECIAPPTAIWAIFLNNDDIVFLIDPHRIVNHIEMILDRRKPS